jgi:hypothetical protein
MRILGVLLIVLGVGALALGGFTVSRRETVAEVGPVKVTTERKQSVPVRPAFAVASIVAGLALVLIGARRRT